MEIDDSYHFKCCLLCSEQYESSKSLCVRRLIYTSILFILLVKTKEKNGEISAFKGDQVCQVLVLLGFFLFLLLLLNFGRVNA